MRRFLSPTLLMGLANLPFGLVGALALVTTPQLLAARDVPQPQIASITAAALIPTFASFLLAPIIDVRFSRRSYAWALGIASAVLAVVVLVNLDRPAWFAPLLVVGVLAAALYNIAVGGWLGDIVPKGEEAQLGAGFQLGNIGGFGLGAILFISLLRALPGWPGAFTVGAVVAAPLLILLRVPVSVRDRRGLHESFGTLGRDLVALIGQRTVRRCLLLFVLPTCGFAMSNSLAGLGHLFGASEQFVALVAGTAVAAIGAVASLLTPLLIRRVAPALVFLGIGIVGAAFTASFLLLPRTPAVLALAIGGENGLQAVAFTVASTITFRSIGEDNPLAATQFGLLTAAVALPTTYMQWVDGRAYAAGGLGGALTTDATLALLGALILLPVVLAWRRRGERAF